MFIINQDPKCFKEDVYIPAKQFGFLNHHPLNFEFIGPDREPVLIEIGELCVKVADIIRNTGLPNFRMARIPLKSGLNISAWEELLQDYPDKHLIQYLKFEFPRSLTHPDSLHNQYVTNHHSAIQFPKAVEEYIAKEQAPGVLSGPVNNFLLQVYTVPLSLPGLRTVIREE